MTVIFVDSNVFLRFFVADDSEQHGQAKSLFCQAAAGEIQLITGPPVLFEISWTLRRGYKQTNDQALEVIASMVRLPGLDMTDGPVVERALGYAWAHGMDFADAYVAALAELAGATGLATFNRKHFEKHFHLHLMK
jgi:uncharacterized protein